MASLIPFWRRRTGAQQRVFSLVKVLLEHGHQVKTFAPIDVSTHDQELIHRHDLDVLKYQGDIPPEGILAKARWYSRAVANRFKVDRPDPPDRPNRPDRPARDKQSPTPPPMRLSDFRWPLVGRAFETHFQQYQPDLVLCQYITTGWLLDGLPQRQTKDRQTKDRQSITAHYMIDTHDLLARRNEQFKQRGFDHWIDVTAQEEAQVLQKFDSIVAIQAEEATAMKTMAPDSQVIVVGHWPHRSVSSRPTGHVSKNSSKSPQPEHKLTLGYIGSDNASNRDAIKEFLQHAWPVVGANAKVELLVAGKICDHFTTAADKLNQSNLGQIRLLGMVADVEDFYREIDLAINPVQFGTGLKIKTAEALSFGVPVITTEPPISQNNVEKLAVGALVCVESLSQMADWISRLLTDGEEAIENLNNPVKAAQDFNYQTRQAVYRELLELIENLP